MPNLYDDIVTTCLDRDCIEHWKEWKLRSEIIFDEKIKQNDEDLISTFVKVAKDRRQHVIGMQSLSSILTEKNFWKKLVVCLATSQSASGEKSLVQYMVCKKDQLLDPASDIYQDNQQSEDQLFKAIEKYVSTVKQRKEMRGVRFASKFSEFVAKAWFILFKHGFVKCYLSKLNFVYSHISNMTDEDKRYNEISITAMLELLPGIGFKQSRNVLQYLGVSQQVIPIDSRWCKLLEDRKFFSRNPDNDFLVIISSVKSSKIHELLQEQKYYLILEEFLLRICSCLDIEPYLFDALMFASHNNKK